MYFLDGNRIYIKPEKGCGTLDEQLENCFLQLKNINEGKQVFKLNFFVDSESHEEYNKRQESIKKKVEDHFSTNVIQSVIAQPPLTCKVIIEAFFYDPSKWEMSIVSVKDGNSALFSKEGTRVLIGNTQSSRFSSCRDNSESAFARLNELFDKASLPLNSIIRKWNYLEDILGYDEKKQRYQEFNNVRSNVYGNIFEEKGYPAATGIGMKKGGVIIEFVAVISKEALTFPVDNPDQVSAHKYSRDVLVGDERIQKTTPKFERARYFELFGKKQIFISGTASILGEKTVGIGDAGKQAEVTIQNIKRLYSREILEKISGRKIQPKYGHARVYVKNRNDFAVIRRTFKIHFGNLPVVYIIADICRDELLVEIEGKVILE